VRLNPDRQPPAGVGPLSPLGLLPGNKMMRQVEAEARRPRAAGVVHWALMGYAPSCRPARSREDLGNAHECLTHCPAWVFHALTEGADELFLLQM